MTILMLMSVPFHPPFGGANKANRTLAHLLAGRHRVEVIAPALGTPARVSLAALRREMSEFGDERRDERAGASVLRYVSGTLDVRLVVDPRTMRRYVSTRITDLAPDVIVVSSEEPTQSLLDTAVTGAPGRVVYLLHTPNFLPFGPLAFYPGDRRTRLFERVGAIVAVSRFSAEYVRRWSGYEASVCYLPVYGDGPYPACASGEAGALTLINPCRYKGIDIFLGLADALPGREFAAVPTWGTTAADGAALESRPNVRVLQPSIDIDDIFRRTRVLLMPSLWLENFPMTAIEAMLRGLPVLAADVGGLPEAKLGTWGVLPVTPIAAFHEALDENSLLAAEVSEQDLTPWIDAIARLDDRTFYQAQAAAARAAAQRFVDGLSLEPFEALLTDIAERASCRS